MTSNQEKSGFDPPPPNYDQAAGYPGAPPPQQPPPQGGYPSVQQEYAPVHGAPPQGGYPAAPQQGPYPGAQQGVYPDLPPQGGYPAAPPQGGYVAMQPQQPQTVVVMAAPQVGLGKEPVTMDCPSCRAHITTRIESTPGLVAWLIFVSMFISGFFILFPWFCCCFPFCSRSLQDTSHTCPSCNNFIGKHKASC